MKHALIIEDEWLIAAHMQDLLESLGFDSVDLATTEDEAIKAARVRRPDLITSDIRLMEGCGPDAVRRIMAEQGPIPVVFVTGNPEIIAPSPDMLVIAKPIDDDRVIKACRSLLHA